MLKPSHMNQENTPLAFEVPDGREATGGLDLTVAEQHELGVAYFAMDKSWIKLYRKMQDHWVYKNPNYTNIWLAILWGTNWKQSKVLVHGKLVIVERGEILTSIRTLAQQSHTSEKSVRNFLKHAEVDAMILPKKGTATTHFIVLNYNDLQEQQSTEGHTEGTARAQQGHYHKKLRSKEGKKEEVKEDSVSMRSRAFTRPSCQEILDYFQELGSTADEAHKFFDHYTANGWKVGKNAMKDWKATARNWNRNKNNFRNSNGTQKRTLGDREVEIDYQKLFADSNEWLRKRGIESSIGGLGQGNGFALGDGSQNQD
jgi:hypothetical protein